MSFQKKVKLHLSDYRVKVLGENEMGYWKRNGQLYPHILPKEKWQLNVLPNYRKELIDYIEEENIHLHKDFHHLNSSQAVCLNFFYPLIVENATHLFLELFHLDKEPIRKCKFEVVKDRSEGTNFDYYIQLKSGRQLFFEIKYSENGFGKVSDSRRYRQKYEEIYHQRLAGKLKDGIPQYETLIKNYQLLRNISYVDAEEKNLLIMICPKENKKLYQEYANMINNAIEPSLHNKIHFITWGEMLSFIKRKLENNPHIPSKLLEHYDLFEEKYILF